MATNKRSLRGDRLRFLREQMKMTQEEFEKFLGFSKGVISRYETGGADPLPSQLVEMANKLDVTTDWLLGLTDDPEGYRKSKQTTPEEQILLEKYRSGELDKLAYDLLGESLYRKSLGKPDNSDPKNKDSESDAA